MNRLLVVDSHSLAYKFFYAIRGLNAPDGTPVQALFGFSRLLHQIITDQNYSHIAFCFDAPTGSKARTKLYPDYKIQREKMPEDLIVQMPLIKTMFEKSGIATFEVPGYEADDIIAWFAQTCTDMEIDIFSSDKDLGQLITDRIHILKSYPDERYTLKKPNKWGLKPREILDFLALMGDASDNIPGIKGIGEKTALKLISTYGSLENLYHHLDEQKGALHKKLQTGKEAAWLSRDLARLRPPKQVKIDTAHLLLQNINHQTLHEFWNAHGFKSLVPKDFSSQQAAAPLPQLNYPLILWHKDSIYLYREGTFFAFTDETDAPDSPVYTYGINRILKTFPGLFPRIKTDIQLLCAASGTDKGESLDKEALVRKIPDMLAEIPKAISTMVAEQELPLADIINRMSAHGIRIDTLQWQTLLTEISKELETLEKNIFETIGTDCNLNSPKQLAFILYEKLNLPVIKRTKTGASTNAQVLTELAKMHPVPKMILKYRSLSKLKNTYLAPFTHMIDHKHTIHSTFLQTKTATGRLSSLEPNLQNLPFKGDYADRIRACFTTSKSNVFIAGDYSQIELRVLADLSKDPHLIEIFKRDEDIHTTTAQHIFGKKEIAPQERRLAKVINFGIIYGMGEYRVSQETGFSMQEAKAFIDRYFSLFAGIKTYIGETIESAKQKGFVETYSGWRRFLPDITSRNKTLRRQAERMAINLPVQGGAADLIKRAMLDIDQAVSNTQLVLQIHDELVYTVPKKDAEKSEKQITKIMEAALKLAVPLKVNTTIGSTLKK